MRRQTGAVGAGSWIINGNRPPTRRISKWIPAAVIIIIIIRRRIINNKTGHWINLQESEGEQQPWLVSIHAFGGMTNRDDKSINMLLSLYGGWKWWSRRPKSMTLLRYLPAPELYCSAELFRRMGTTRSYSHLEEQQETGSRATESHKIFTFQLSRTFGGI